MRVGIVLIIYCFVQRSFHLHYKLETQVSKIEYKHVQLAPDTDTQC